MTAIRTLGKLQVWSDRGHVTPTFFPKTLIAPPKPNQTPVSIIFLIIASG